MMRRLCLAAATCGGLLGYIPASAQSVPTISLNAETDHRDRGLSASGGKGALGASASVPVLYGLALDLDAVTLRGSARHGGADIGVVIAPQYGVLSGGWELGAGARGHVFVGRSGLSYGELTADVGRTLGPARLVVGAAFAPAQAAIGGSNLYLDAQLSASIPGTPVTLYGGFGHTSGSANGGARAARLRPGGAYLDHHVGAEYVSGKIAGGIRYSGTSIGAEEVNRMSPWTDQHYGSRALAYVRFTP
ncbi:TorF family putative porin [Novosphingobium sp. P6W]|uniref:TorF family putative porin n=1 Tax=Novosphingobium sp. P6W TaxID=1609758 RepID=UPI000696C112|nr:TorF family putative porin [Novosphingobium sp. P6W]